MNARLAAKEVVRAARDRRWDDVDRLLDWLVAAAEREHPIVTDVLTRTPPERQPIEPSDPE